MKFIDRAKFELMGYNSATSYCGKEDKEYGMVYNCNKNIAKCNPLEFLWFYSEMIAHKSANIGRMILFIVCPWYYDIYWMFKRGDINMSLPVRDFFGLIVILIFTLTGIGVIISICDSILEPIYYRKRIPEQSQWFRTQQKG